MTAVDNSLTSSVSFRSAYSISAICIFAFMAYTFLFPCNRLIPLDRRTVAVLCSILCYITREYAFSNKSMDLVAAIDFDVLVLLASIMAINHIVVHLKETKRVISYLQDLINLNPRRGFWMVSILAMLISPFLTNDGVCLLFVEPILNAFQSKSIINNAMVSHDDSSTDNSPQKFELETSDSVYFMLTLACSANIGSALTYTGNPQNMLVSEDALSVMPSYMFTAYMILPTLFAWLTTTFWIEYTWLASKRINSLKFTKLRDNDSILATDDLSHQQMELSLVTKFELSDASVEVTSESQKSSKSYLGSIVRCALPINDSSNALSPSSPRRRRAKKIEEREQMIKNVVVVISSPFPYMILLLLATMIVLIFVDVMSIAGLVCVSAIVMIVSLVIGNHWRGKPIWTEETGDKEINSDGLTVDGQIDYEPLTAEEKIDNLNDFFEELFNSLDYSLLFIFLGTFIVVANLDSTGIPKFTWDLIVGKIPFKSAGSVIGISLFVLISSQFLGNVAVVQLAKPNVETLEFMEKKYAWAVISFVATIGGNLTITGSAANIIVSEKSSRIDPNSSIDFFRHFRVCFIVTLLSCFVGGLVITLLMHIENSFNH